MKNRPVIVAVATEETGDCLRVLDDGTLFYGAIPDWLFVRVRESVGRWAGQQKMRITRRTE